MAFIKLLTLPTRSIVVNKRNFKRIVIVHPGKAHYPELEAYKSYFKEKYSVKIVSIDKLNTNFFDKETILWFIMGFYPKKYKAGFIIHDYRSLSVGKFAKIKNFAKRYLQQKPNLRIFLNDYVKKEMNFKDNIPYCYLDMGVPDYLLSYKRKKKKEKIYDFIYVGEISKERESDKMLKNFLSIYGKRRSIILVGKYEKDIYEKFSSYENIIFTGRITQHKVFTLMLQAKVGLNFIPMKYPYDYQTSTKMLEYASMGLKIISTKTKANFYLAKKYNIHCMFVENFAFPREDELIMLRDNSNFNVEEVIWSRVIQESGIHHYIT